MAEGRSWKGNTRPPRPEHSSVPSWEKTFCTSVCRVPWEKICATKYMMPGYKNVADWDDSGAHEAFNNAKSRYWVEINGLSCDIPLPDPNIYIDEVDDNDFVDPELVADLYRRPPSPPREINQYEDLSYEAFLNAKLPVKATGWGDAEEEDTTERHSKWDALIEKPLPATGWGDAEDHLPTNENPSNSWNESGGWGDGAGCDASRRGPECNTSLVKQGNYVPGGRHWDNWNNEQGRRNDRNRNGFGSRISKSRYPADWNYEQGRRNGRNRNGYGPRISKPRYQADNYQQNTCMADATYEKTMHTGKPMATGQWKPKLQPSCGQMNGQR